MDILAPSCPGNVSSLHYDTACLEIHNELEDAVNLYSLSHDCYKCDPQFWTGVPFRETVNLIAPAVKTFTFLITSQNDNNNILCEQTVALSQHALVSWIISENETSKVSCTFTIEEEGDNSYLPLEIFITGFISSWFLIFLIRSIFNSQWVQQLFSRDPIVIDLQNDLGNPNSSSVDSLPLVQSELVPLRRLSSPRVQALDTFRGMTMSLMIFVNYGGGKYWFFQHSAWNGLTIADFIFPWFAWVMGVSLVLSYRSKLRSCVSRSNVLVVSVRRSLILITLGLLLNTYNHNDISTVRFCGVLQRLGIAHLVVSTLETVFMKKQPTLQYGRWLSATELVDTWRQWLVVLALVFIHLYFTFFHPIPGCPTGYVGPGGLSNHSFAPNCTGGAARYIDSLVFKDAHMYQHSPVQKVYNTSVPFDPEGILGTFTCILTVYLGVQAGYIILSYNSTLARSLRWLFWAVLTGVTAGFLCGWSKEEGLIPINKQLWSLSYALLTSSTAFIIFTILFLSVDHIRCLNCILFKYAGMNGILLYIGHVITKNTFPWSWKPHDLTSHGEFFSMNLVGVMLWLSIAGVLHKNQIYVTV